MMKKRNVVRVMLFTMLLTLLLGMSASAKAVKSQTFKMKAENGSYTYSGKYIGEKYVYLRFKVKSTGIVRVTGYEKNKKGVESGFHVILCDKNKKRMDVNKKNYVNFNSGKKKGNTNKRDTRIQYYTLSKGTYYFRLYPNRKKVGTRYIVQASFTKMGNYAKQTASSRDEVENNSQMAYLSKGNSCFAVITASDPVDSGRWIQFYTDGEDPVELTFIPQLQNSTQGTFTAYIYGPSYKDGKELTISKGGDRYKLSTTVTRANGTKKTTGPKKGDYYIKICRENTTPDNMKFANGYIKVKRD